MCLDFVRTPKIIRRKDAVTAYKVFRRNDDCSVLKGRFIAVLARTHGAGIIDAVTRKHYYKIGKPMRALPLIKARKTKHQQALKPRYFGFHAYKKLADAQDERVFSTVIYRVKLWGKIYEARGVYAAHWMEIEEIVEDGYETRRS